MFNVTTEKIIKSIESPVVLSSERKANWSSDRCCFVFSGITWTTASGQTCLFASSRRLSRVRAFTSLLEPCRWALPALSSALHCCCSASKEIHGSISTKPDLKSPLSFSLFDFQIPLPTRPHWFLLFGTTEEEIQEICLTTLKLYTRKKVSLTCWGLLLDA